MGNVPQTPSNETGGYKKKLKKKKQEKAAKTVKGRLVLSSPERFQAKRV